MACFIRHVKGLEMDHVDVSYVKDEIRPPIALNDVDGADFDHVRARRTPDVPFFVLHNVSDFTLHNSPGLTNTNRATVERDSF
jgi:hypothetical protein